MAGSKDLTARLFSANRLVELRANLVVATETHWCGDMWLKRTLTSEWEMRRAKK